MKFTINRRALGAVFGAAVATAVGLSAAPVLADYPEKPINLIIGFSAGGGNDLTGRALAAELQKTLGKPVVVVNKPGAGSMIAAQFVADARPDGYTLLFGSVGTIILQKELGNSELDGLTDFRLAGNTSSLIPAIAVPLDSPYNSVQDIIDDAKKRPGELRWAHGGTGSAFMASGVGFIEANGMDVKPVPFNGAAKARIAIIGGQVDFGIQNQNARLAFGDKMKVLGALRGTRENLIDKELPAVGEDGIEFIAINSPVGLLAPAGVSDEIMAALSDAVAKAASDEGFIETMGNLKFPVEYVAPEDAAPQALEIRQNVQKLLPQIQAN